MLVFSIFLLIGVSNAAPGARIVGGNNAEEHAWPWQLSLQYNGRHTCGASLISEEYAITAAHCVGGSPEQVCPIPGGYDFRGTSPFCEVSASSYSVVAGEHDLGKYSTKEKRIYISEITTHPGYNPSGTGYPNDIAVLKLSSPAVLEKGIIETVDLPNGRTDYENAQECFITGWGRLSGGGTIPDILQEAESGVLSPYDCENFYLFGNYVNSYYHICAFTGDNGACNGDSGGPLVCRFDDQWEVAGAASWVISGCDIRYPTAYVRISSYVPWIKSVTGLQF